MAFITTDLVVGCIASGVGAATSSLTLTNAGVGYTPAGTAVPGGSAASDTFNDVSFTTVTGLGQNARGNVLVNNGEVLQVTVTSGGNGYTVGDVVTATLGNGVGEGFRATVGTDNLHSFNELILTDVQGDFDTSATAYSLRYVDNILGIGTVINYAGSTLEESSIYAKVYQ